MLSADCRSICTGKYIDPQRMESLVDGEGAYWRKFKSDILQHMTCATDGQTHFKALSALSEERNLRKHHYEAAETLLKSAITAVKSKSAASHYEDQIAFAYSVGAQVGQTGHSRKLVPDLIKCLLHVIYQRTKNKLLQCLPSTGLPPHFSMAVDKGTVNKRTNQAVIICPVLDGVKTPIVVGAPEVYSLCSEGRVEGGKALDSATQALHEIEAKFGKASLDYLIGVSADGVYQAHGFCDVLGEGHARTFLRKVSWDPSHWMNLAVTDVRDGKLGSSKLFFSHFIERTNRFSEIFCRGKGRSFLESSASHLGVTAGVAGTYSQTRFASSAFVQWQRLAKSYKVFASALKNAAPAVMMNEQHPLQYQCLGQVKIGS